MKNHNLPALVAAVLFAAVTVIGGCSSESEAQKHASVIDEVVDSLASALAENLTFATPVNAIIEEEEVDTFEPEKGSTTFSDLMIVDSTVYASVDEGVLVYDLSSDDFFVIPVDEPLHAVTYHMGVVYVGGESLFKVVDSVLEPVNVELTGVITDLYSYDYRLMIGTGCGLYATSIFGYDHLFDDISVTSMIADNNGLWIGTNGHGLYHWDGREFHRRYLRRDTTIFDYVNTLEFSHNHLYVGTGEAMYIYDGGRWKTITTENGLPSNEINAIDASAWTVYIATPKGVASFVNDEVTPVKKLDDVPAATLKVYGSSIVVGTEDQRLLKKTGPVVRTLIDAAVDKPVDPVALTVH